MRWAHRRHVLFWRGCVTGSRLRQLVVPRLAALRSGALPVPVDVADSGWFGRNGGNYTPLPQQCENKFLLHLEGGAR